MSILSPLHDKEETAMRENACMVAAWMYLALFPILLAAAPGQQDPSPKRPTAEAHIVRIEYGSSSGMCNVRTSCANRWKVRGL